MQIAKTYRAGHLGISFELFPPKTEKGETALFGHVKKLMAYKPDYITCTYGAGGSTQTKTLDIIAKIGIEHQIPVATHLTCVGRTKDELVSYLQEAVKRGVKNVVALRGDPPKGETSFSQPIGGFAYANELVEMIRHEFPQLGIGVAGYPDKHQEAPSFEVDIKNLKRKVETGAGVVLTQLFYNNEHYFHFCKQTAAAGIKVPIVPGVLPVTSLAQVQKIASLSGTELPVEFSNALQACGEDTEAQFEVGVQFAITQCQQLIEQGAPGIHFYVLNKSAATSRVLEGLKHLLG